MSSYCPLCNKNVPPDHGHSCVVSTGPIELPKNDAVAQILQEQPALMSKWTRVTGDVIEEAQRAEGLHGPFASFHELESVLREECDEATVEARARDAKKLRAELVQVAAVALRAIRQMDDGEAMK